MLPKKQGGSICTYPVDTLTDEMNGKKEFNYQNEEE